MGLAIFDLWVWGYGVRALWYCGSWVGLSNGVWAGSLSDTRQPMVILATVEADVGESARGLGAPQ